MPESKRLLSSFTAITIGALSFLIHGYHLFEEDAISQILTGVIPPAIISLGLIAAGLYLFETDVKSTCDLRMTTWMIGGAVGLAGIGFALMLYQISHGAKPEDFVFIQANWFTTGALLGLLIGFYNAKMVRAIDELRAERDKLEAREAQLKRENDRQERLVHVVSHDLRNPLTVAKGRIAAIESSASVREVEECLDRMEEIIEDILSMARDGRPVTDVETTIFSLDRLIEQSWDGVETKDAALGNALECQIVADESRVRQLFENLFRNAIEHGGEDVSIRVGKLETADGFFVEDTGPGLPPDRPVFEPGFSTQTGGTGLGLSIVKDIATAHGWEVSTDRGEDGGARFEFSGVEFAR